MVRFCSLLGLGTSLEESVYRAAMPFAQSRLTKRHCIQPSVSDSLAWVPQNGTAPQTLLPVRRCPAPHSRRNGSGEQLM